MPADRARIGAAAEDLAAQFLKARGLTIVRRNFRRRQGEIDLIAKEGATLVFIEVRLRTNPLFGGARESIGKAKQKRLRAAAQHYLAGLSDLPPCRFDAVLLEGLDIDRVEWIQNIISD